MKLFDKVCDLVARLKFKLHYHSGRVIDNEGNQYWYFSNFKPHRDNDLPAYVGKDGTKEWWTFGKRNRGNDLPAVESKLNREWWVNDERHRDFGPAVEKFDGTKEYWHHNQLDRDDGPAIVHPDGTGEYFRKGERWAEGAAKAPEIREQKIEKAVEQATVAGERVRVMSPIRLKKTSPGPNP